MSEVTEPTPLAIYLNDHLAGGTGAIDLVNRAAADFAGQPLGTFLSELATDIQEDHDTLATIMGKVGATPNPIKQLGAKVIEKLSSLKLAGGTSADLSTLLTLETLSIGVEGKACLWQGLKEASDSHDALAAFDFDALFDRAQQQRTGLAKERAAMACVALATPTV